MEQRNRKFREALDAIISHAELAITANSYSECLRWVRAIKDDAQRELDALKEDHEKEAVNG